jgi:hypothetical protein
LPLLLNKSTHPQGGFWKQRGFVLILTVFLATTCMITNKLRYQTLQSNALSPRDSLIKVLAEDSGLFLNDETTRDSSSKKPIRVASQWPAITMLACRCDALPLPPPTAKDSEALYAMLNGINFLIFDPRDQDNASLAHNLATMEAGRTETIVLQKGGVIVQVKTPLPTPTPAQVAPNKT